MSATLAQQAQLLTNPTFIQQVQGALIAAAAAIIQEATTTADHANRIAWANAVIGNPTGQTAYFLPGMLTNSTIVGEAGNAAGASGTPCPDSDVEYVVASLWNIYADNYAAQLNSGAMLTFGH
jgi:hypothetical protein